MKYILHEFRSKRYFKVELIAKVIDARESADKILIMTPIAASHLRRSHK